MKKIKLLALLLAFIMAVSLTACGGDKDTSAEQQGGNTPLTREDDNTPLNREDSTEISGSSQTETSNFNPDDFQSAVESANRNNMTPEQIAELEADAAANGYEIDWAADGSMIIVEGGSAINTSGEWPDNEFTKDVPVPKAGEVTATEITDYGCTIIMSWTTEDAKAYSEELKKDGFDKMVDEQDLAAMGIYTFVASNGEYTVTAGFAGGQGNIGIEKTNPEDLESWEDNPSDEDETSMTDEDMQKQLEEAQKEMEEAQKELEGIELPEGYEDYGDILEGLDLNDLINNNLP